MQRSGTARRIAGVRALALTFLCLAAAGAAWAADDVPPALMRAYNETALRADRVLAEKGPEAAVRIYEEALLNQPFGRFHLRLGQLYRTLDRNAEAAVHFRACMADDRVDGLDRELICQPGFAEVTAPLTVEGLPDGGRVVVVVPRDFAGPFESGGRLPLGAVRLTVEAPGREPRSSDLTLEGPTTWQAVLGLLRRQGPVIPADFIGGDDGQPGPDLVGQRSADTGDGGPLRWPAYVTAGVGVGLVGAGVGLGLANRGDLDDIRARQRSGGCDAFCKQDLLDAQDRAGLADGLWIAGTVVAASAVLVWYLLDD